jgi:undecaprenyl diphosphate synthase
MQWASEATAKNTGTTLTLALNYGARTEIVDAMRVAMRDAIAASQGNFGKLQEMVQSFEESDVTQRLYTAGMPDPDLVIRTSGEQRISNFLLWQIAYAEIFVTDRLWPDFRGLHLLEAIADFQRRERRYGGLGDSFTDEDIEAVRVEAELARR